MKRKIKESCTSTKSDKFRTNETIKATFLGNRTKHHSDSIYQEHASDSKGIAISDRKDAKRFYKFHPHHRSLYLARFRAMLSRGKRRIRRIA